MISDIKNKYKYHKNWIEKNKYTIICECGKKVRKYYISRHRQSKYHSINIRPHNDQIKNIEDRLTDLENEIKKVYNKINRIIL